MAIESSAATSVNKKRIRTMVDEMETLVGDMELSLYGTKSKTDIADMSKDFNTTMRSQMNLINHSSGGDTSSFVAKLFDSELKRKSANGFANSFEDLFTGQDGQVMSYLSEEYRSKMAKYTDLQEVSTQLIELNEAVLIMRDAIISPDITTGTVSRDIGVDGEDDDEDLKSTQLLESMEKKFKLLKKIKNTIVPQTLRFGTYYAYIIPYRDLFSKFEQKKQDPTYGNATRNFSMDNMYQEKTLWQVIVDEEKNAGLNTSNDSEDRTGFFAESTSIMMENLRESAISPEQMDLYNDKDNIAAMEQGFEEMLKRVTICNEACPIPMLEEGPSAIHQLYQESVKHSGGVFEAVHGKDGMFMSDDSSSNSKKNKKKKKKDPFAEVSDCYIKFIDPIHMIPAKIMKKCVGYYWIQATDGPVVSGFFGDNYQTARFGKTGKDRMIVDRLAAKIVNAFDKKFLADNMEMKELIAEALMYFDLNSQSIRFQFIPVEQICPFVINEKEDGEGTSMIEPSLFYAKLYLLLLLFKITSIILYSNDTRVNYIRTSGIDKNIANKVQEIARDNQRHRVNILDLQSYTALLHKIGSGAEKYIPVGRANERGLETEILQGQDIQINTELMELLRTCYILGTGVPSAIMNYLNEADFAKSIEVANTRFLGRVMSYQIDMNECITNFYQMVAKYSTSMDPSDIDNIVFTLTPPKQTNNLVKQEAVSGFEALQAFMMKLFFGEDYQSNQDVNEKKKQLEFVKYLIQTYLPYIDVEEAEKKFEELSIDKVKSALDPANKNTAGIDDLGDDLMGGGMPGLT